MGSPYKFVQGAHAVAGWCLCPIQFGELGDDGSHGWHNDTLIFLDVEDLDRLKLAEFKINQAGIDNTTNYEPDLNDELTAIACVSDNEKFFDQWQLAK